MHTESHHGEVHHKPRHMAERFEGLLGYAMVIAIVLLAIGLVIGVMSGGDATPKYLQ